MADALRQDYTIAMGTESFIGASVLVDYLMSRWLSDVQISAYTADNILLGKGGK